MGSLSYNDSKFIYKEQDMEKILLDCRDFLSNKSKVSMHRFPEAEYLTIPELLIGLLEREKQNGNDLEFPAVLIDLLLVSRLIRSRRPVKVLEYGSMQGQLSLHLAEVLGAFHENSVLVCAYDTIEPEWMERLSQAKRSPKLSFFAGDFGHFQLQESYFDAVIINGMANYIQPEEVITDALRLVSDDGILLCYTDASPLLESTFKLYFEERQEYEATPWQKVLMANVRDRSWQRFPAGDKI